MGMVLLLTLAMVGPPASAAEAPITFTLTRAEVVEGHLQLAGTVTNNSRTPLRTLTVQLWRSTRPLISSAAISKALAETNTTEGSIFSEGSASVILTPRTASFGPGQTAPFAVSAPTKHLGMNVGASYWVGVDAIGRTAAQSKMSRLGSARTLASVTAAPVPVASVVELSAQPRQIKKNLFVDDELAEELSTGRLRALLDAAKSGADYFIDPSLLVEVRDMADGYSVKSGASHVKGTGDAAAAAWLHDFDALAPNHGHTGLFGTPDLSSSRVFPQLQDAAVAAGTDVTSQAAGRAALLVSPGGAALDRIKSLGMPVIALGIQPAATVSASHGVTVVNAGPPSFAATQLLPDTPLNRRNALAAAALAEGGQVRWLRTAADLASDNDPLPAGFQRAPLTTVLVAEPENWTPSASRPRVGSLNPGVVPRLSALRERLLTFGETAPSTGLAELADAQVARGASLWWKDDPAAQTGWLDAIDARIAARRGPAVTLDALPRFSMTGAASDFPVTVTNHLPDPAVVQVKVDIDNPQRIRFAVPAPVTVAPGASNTVTLAASEAGGGVVLARVHVEAETGRRLTPDRLITVETTNFGVIAWALVIISGIVLVVSTALRIKVVRARQKAVSHG